MKFEIDEVLTVFCLGGADLILLVCNQKVLFINMIDA